MRFIGASVAAIALTALPFAPVPLAFVSAASAQSISERECEAAGGTFAKDGPNATCVFPSVTTKPGNNPPGEQGSESTTTRTDTGQGNLGNKTRSETDCEGNKGQCKPN
jgi:hypothetical protein